MVKVRSVQHSVEVGKGPKQTNKCTPASVLATFQKSAISFCGRQKEVKHFFLCPTALVLFNSSLWTHYPRCKYTLDNCSSVLKDHIERLLARCPRVFLPPTAFLSLLGRPISDALNRFCAWWALRVGWVSICLSMHR